MLLELIVILQLCKNNLNFVSASTWAKRKDISKIFWAHTTPTSLIWLNAWYIVQKNLAGSDQGDLIISQQCFGILIIYVLISFHFSSGKEVVIYKTLSMKIHFRLLHEYAKTICYRNNIQSVLKIEQNRRNIFNSKALAFYICNVKLIISFRVLFIMIINWKRVQFF